MSDTIQDIRQALSKVQADLARAEAEEEVRTRRREQLLKTLRDTYGLTLEDAPRWIEEKERAAKELAETSARKVQQAADGVRRIRAAQAGEDVDLSDLLPAEDGELP
jgi:hypothetical protein